DSDAERRRALVLLVLRLHSASGPDRGRVETTGQTVAARSTVAKYRPRRTLQARAAPPAPGPSLAPRGARRARGWPPRLRRAAVAPTAAARIRLIPYVADTPRWNSNGQVDFWKRPPADLRAFTELMALLAGRYRGSIRSWEIWNEPDNPDFWAGSAADYAALL